MNKRNVVACLPRGREVLTSAAHYRRSGTNRRRIQRSREVKKAQALLRRLTREGLRLCDSVIGW
jgi:hypothetical protein